MKYIFDFDDVLFATTKELKPRMFRLIAAAGVPEEKARNFYLEARKKEFSLKNFIRELFTQFNINHNKLESVYENIMKDSPNFVNAVLIDKIKNLGKENCYIVTNGDKEFNQDKINYCGIGNLFAKIYIVPGTKKEVIYEICGKYKNEKVIFTDDKIKFFEDIDLSKVPNLSNILYSM